MAEEAIAERLVAVLAPKVELKEGRGHQVDQPADALPTADQELFQVKSLLDCPDGVFHAPVIATRARTKCPYDPAAAPGD